MTSTGCGVFFSTDDGFEAEDDDGGNDEGADQPASCPDRFDGSDGANQIVRFTWDRGIFGCLLGCGADERIAVGSEATLHILEHENLPPGYVVSSRDPAIIDFQSEPSVPSLVRVTAKQQGRARLLIHDGDTGELIDARTFESREIMDLEQSYPEYRERVTIYEGGSTSIGMELIDEEGCHLVGVGAVEYELTDGLSEPDAGLIAVFIDWLEDLLVGSVDEYVTVVTTSPGEGTVVATTRDDELAVEVPLAIVDATDITDVALSGDEENPTAGGEGYGVSASAFAGDEVVHDPDCVWELSPGDGPVHLESVGNDYVTLEAAEPGSATLGCRIGDAEDALEITFE